MQKRGEIVDADDFLPVRNTYPIHPDTLKEPRFKTSVGMATEKKTEDRQHLEKKKKEWDDANPIEVERKFI